MSWITNFFKWLSNLLCDIFGLDCGTAGDGKPPDVVITDPPGDPFPSQPNKYAVIVGVSKYWDSSMDLHGPQNDVTEIWTLLKDVYGFPQENLRVLVNERAKEHHIIDRLEWLLSNTEAGDELVFYFSGHGSQLRDRDGDELDDGMDEFVLPHDFTWDTTHYIIDDHLYDIFKDLAPGANLTMICDSCHSGTMTRSIKPPKQNPKKLQVQKRVVYPPFDLEARFKDVELPVNKFGAKSEEGQIKSADQRHVLLSGCRDDQVSWSAVFDGGYWHGGLSYYLVKALKKNPNLTWREVLPEINRGLEAKGLDQNPQLSGMDKLLDRPVFGGAKKDE